MSVVNLVRSVSTSTGYDEGSLRHSRRAFTCNGTGNGLQVVYDLANNQIHLYEAASATSRATWTLRTSITLGAPQGGASTGQQVTAAIFPDNSIGIVLRHLLNTSIWYCKITYGTWAVSAWEQVGPTLAPSSTVPGYHKCDVAITDGGAPVVIAWEAVGGGAAGFVGTHTLRAWSKALTGGAWVQINGAGGLFSQTGVKMPLGSRSLSVSTLPGSGATARPVVIAFAYGVAPSGNNYTTDAGLQVRTFTLNENDGSTGTINTQAAMSGLCANEITSDQTNVAIEERLIRLFRHSNTEITLGMMHATVNRKIMVTRLSHSGSGVFGVSVNPAYSNLGYATSYNTMAMTYGSNTLTYHYLSTANNGVSNIFGQVASIDPITGVVSYSSTGAVRYPSNGTTSLSPVGSIAGNGDRFNSNSRHELQYVQKLATNTAPPYNASYVSLWMNPEYTPAITIPSAGGTVTTSNPAFRAIADFGVRWPQSALNLFVQFATDSAFTSNVKTYIQPYSKLVFQYGASDAAPNKVTIDDSLPLYTNRLAQGVWYMRVASTDEHSNLSPYSPTVSFTVTHTPSATQVGPGNDSIYSWNAGQILFDWTFSDPSSDEYQTAYEIEVTDTTTSSIILSTGKVVTSATEAQLTIPTPQKDKRLSWRIRVYDRDNVVGPWSALQYFTMSDPPVVTITAPTSGATVTNGVPSVSLSINTGTKSAIAYNVSITQGSTLIWSASATGSWANGSTITVVGDKSYLKNSQSYTVNATVTDSLNMSADAPPAAFTTAWTPPAAPTGLAVDVTPYNVDNQGWVKITWSDAARDADFAGWVIYRKDEQINTLGVVVQPANFVEIARVTQVNTSGYEYHDYTAPSGYQTTYLVTQNVNRFGDQVESTNTSGIAVVPRSDGYWLIELNTGNVAPDAFRLSNVTNDQFTDEWDEAEYVVIGRGRHVDRGDDLGAKGQLDAQLRDTQGGTTARQKRLMLQTIKQDNRQLWLRNPFGDIMRVSVGNISISRIAGVGTQEFVDVTIPYTEVSQ